MKRRGKEQRTSQNQEYGQAIAQTLRQIEQMPEAERGAALKVFRQQLKNTGIFLRRQGGNIIYRTPGGGLPGTQREDLHLQGVAAESTGKAMKDLADELENRLFEWGWNGWDPRGRTEVDEGNSLETDRNFFAGI